MESEKEKKQTESFEENAVLNESENQKELQSEAKNDCEEKIEENDETESDLTYGIRLSAEAKKKYEQSRLLLQGYRIGKGISEEELESALKDLFAIARDVESGTISIEQVELLKKGRDYAQHVAKARNEGEVSGRNARLDQLIGTESVKDTSPRMGSATPETPRKSGNTIFDLAGAAR